MEVVNLQCVCESYNKWTGYYTVPFLEQNSQPKIIVLGSFKGLLKLIISLRCLQLKLQPSNGQLCPAIWLSLLKCGHF